MYARETLKGNILDSTLIPACSRTRNNHNHTTPTRFCLQARPTHADPCAVSPGRKRRRIPISFDLCVCHPCAGAVLSLSCIVPDQQSCFPACMWGGAAVQGYGVGGEGGRWRRSSQEGRQEGGGSGVAGRKPPDADGAQRQQVQRGQGNSLPPPPSAPTPPPLAPTHKQTEDDHGRQARHTHRRGVHNPLKRSAPLQAHAPMRGLARAVWGLATPLSPGRPPSL